MNGVWGAGWVGGVGCGSVCGMYVCACAEGVCVEGALEWECGVRKRV